MRCFNTRIARQRLSVSFCRVLAVVAVAAMVATPAQAVIFTAGELLVDLKVNDLVSDATAWTNRASGSAAVGDFTDVDASPLNLGVDIGGVPISLSLLSEGEGGLEPMVSNSIVSAGNTPSSVQGNQTRTVEAWIYSTDTSGSQSVVAWGATSNNSMSRFSYNTGGNGLLSAWFNDTGWGNNEALLADEWVHYAVTYDGFMTRGYINGEKIAEVAQPAPLTTPESVVNIGARPGAGNDPFKGYIADVRVHSGVLNDAQILTNFQEGIGEADGLGCDFDGDGDCDSIDFTSLSDNLFTPGGVEQGDYDRSGFIDLADYRAFKDDPNTVIGVVGPASPTNSAAPEPSAVVSLAAVFVFLNGTGVRSRRKF